MARVLVIGSFAESLIRLRGHLLQQMVKNGHEVIAAAPGIAPDVSRTLANMGVEYRRVSLSRAGLNPFVDLYGLYCLFRLFRAVKPDVYFGYAIKPVVYGTLVARLTGVDRIYSMIPGVGYAFSDDSAKSRFIGLIAKAMYRRTFRVTDRVFFQNPDDKQLFLDLGLLKDEGQACLINGSGVDIDTFTPAPFPAKLTFLLVSRLLGVKGIGEYAAAAAAIRRTNPDVVCRLVGFFEDSPSGLTASDIQSWVDNGAIEFIGPLDDVRPALAQSSVFVLPSYYREGTPRAILEAMASGRPVITTDAPGCRETVVDGRNGFLVPARDIEALVAAMRYFVEQPDKVAVMGAESRRLAIDKYDVRKVTRSIIEAMQLGCTNA